MNDDAWLMYLINLASIDCVARRPAIRHLYTHTGLEVDEIAETCDIDVALVRDALNRIP